MLPLEDVPASAMGGGREDRVRRRTDSIESELNARFELRVGRAKDRGSQEDEIVSQN